MVTKKEERSEKDGLIIIDEWLEFESDKEAREWFDNLPLYDKNKWDKINNNKQQK